MTIFTPQATRARHKYFDRTMSEAEAMLHDPAVINTLGQVVIGTYSDLIDCYYVPNVRDNKVCLPKKGPHSEKGIPVVPIAKVDDFILPERTEKFHPLQLVAMGNRLLEWGLNESSAQSMGTKIEAISLQNLRIIRYDDEVYGAVDCVESRQVLRNPQWDGPIPIQVFGAPHVLLNMDTEEGELEEALTLLHETEHVRQFMTEPILKDCEDYAGQYTDIKESEALEIEDSVQLALYSASNNPKYKAWAPLENAQHIA